jgi:hypothetical protein
MSKLFSVGRKSCIDPAERVLELLVLHNRFFAILFIYASA